MISKNSGQPENTNPCREFLDYFRCPSQFARFGMAPEANVSKSFFRFGPAICFGDIATRSASNSRNKILFDALPATKPYPSGEICFPFDPDEVVKNLRLERYV